MTRALLLAEKPSLMRKIQAVYKTMSNCDSIDFIALAGHITTAKKPDEIKEEWKPWTFNNLPIIPEVLEYKVNPNTKDIYDRIQIAIKKNKYDYIINACDPDREGQAIFQHTYDVLGLKMPIKRFWTNDLTEDSIKNALLNLRHDNDGKLPNLKYLTHASMLRGETDWLLGMNGTRAASVKKGAVVNVGRVKMPTLKIVVDRELAIRNFVPKTSYGIEGVFNGYEGTYVVKEEDENNKTVFRSKLWDTKKEAENIGNSIPKKLVVISATKEEEKKNAPQLYTTSAIQKDASDTYGYSIAETLELLQSLYEKEVTSYPRTDNPCISTELCAEFPTILESLEVIPVLGDFAAKYKNDKKSHDLVKKTKKYVDDKKMAEAGHYAIIPTGRKFNYDYLSQQEKNILKLIAQRFISIFMPPMRSWSKEIIVGDNSNHHFKVVGKTLIDLGYYEVLGKTFSDKELPDLKQGESVDLIGTNIYESTTSAPSRFTDGSLATTMKNPVNYLRDTSFKNIIKEVQGIGTEATRSGIIGELISQGYIEEKAGKGKAKQLYASEKSIALMEELGETFITSVDLTAKWEGYLSDVALGKMTQNQYRSQLNEFIVQVVDDLKKSNIQHTGKQSSGPVVIGKCPLCGDDVIAGKSYFFCKNYRKEKDCKFILGKEINGATLNEAEAQKILEGKETKAFKMKSKEGKTYNAKFKWDAEKQKVGLVFDNKASSKETKLVCPICGKGHLSTGKGQYGNFYRCPECSFIFSETYNKHKLTAKEIKAIISGGKTDLIEFEKKDGSGKYNAILYLDKNDKKIKMEFAQK